MKCTKYFSLFLFALSMQSATFALGKKDAADSTAAKTTEEKSEETKKDHFQIDLTLDTKKENPKNHFNWNTSSVKYKDSFDAISGASKTHSTKHMRESFFDKNAKDFTIPKGLYCLCLFTVADFSTLQKDDFKISREGKKLSISFSHRGNAYKIASDENGMIIVPDSFAIKESEKAEKKSEDANSGAENQKTESQASEAPKSDDKPGLSDFHADKAGEAVKQCYKGKLKADLSPEGILSIKGKLLLSENKSEEPKEAEKPIPEEKIPEQEEKPRPGVEQ